MSTVLITGCSRGIGLGLVREYLKHDYKVIATCRNPAGASDLQKVLADAGQAPAISLDVASDESIFKAAEEVGKIVDAIDILINNAGVAAKNHPVDPATKVDREDALRIYNTNVIGPLKVTEAFLPLLRKGNEKKIVNISSDSGSLASVDELVKMGFVFLTTYSASKAALNMVTRYQAFELKDFIVVSLEPSFVETDLANCFHISPYLKVEESGQKLYATIAGLKGSDTSFFLGIDGERFPF